MPIILPANSAASGDFEAANSCRFDRSSTDFLNKTLGTPTNVDKATFSTWVKFVEDTSSGNDATLFGVLEDGNNTTYIQLLGSKVIRLNMRESTNYIGVLTTNRVFRDPSAWYHIVVAFDTTQGTDSNRIKLYVNGVQETSFSTATYPSQNTDLRFNTSGQVFNIGRRGDSVNLLDGYLAETVFIDGQQLDPTSFGEFDEDSGIWKPKNVSGLTFGNNGFYLDYEDSGNLGNDVSGGTDLTVNNLTAIDQSTDTCTNNAPTFNPLFLSEGTTAFSEGNLKFVSSGTNGGSLSTIGVSSGKWYIEVKQTGANEPLGNGEMLICVVGDPAATKGTIDNYEGRAFAYGIRNHSGTKFANTSGSTSWHGNWTAGDIISIALDMDNNNVYFAKNGQYANGSGSWNQAFTGSPAAVALSTDKTFYFIGVGHAHSSATGTFELNALSPSFSISSSNQDSESLGDFEYSVPSGYLALCTKNLAENS